MHILPVNYLLKYARSTKNEKKGILMQKILILLLIISLSAIPVIAEDIEWVDAQVKTLRFDEFISRDGYLIQATDFNNGSVLITVFRANKSFVTRNISRKGESQEINNELNITILDLQEVRGTIGANRGMNVVVDSWVKIQTKIAGKPLPKISIFSYQGKINNRTKVSPSFRSNSEIWVDFLIKNDGKALLKNFIFKINSTLPLVAGEKLDYDLYELKGGNESDMITVRFIAPFVDQNKLFTIIAQVDGKDMFGRSYKVTEEKNIEVVPFFSNSGIINIRKYVSEKVFLGDLAVVSLYIENNGSKRISNITLSETLPSGLEPLTNNLKWNFTLEPFQTESISYQIKPKKPGNYFFMPGSSRIEYKDELYYNNKTSKLIVTGPYVVLTKSASAIDVVKGENVTILIEAKNLGDATAIVKLSDEVPVNYSLFGSLSDTIFDIMILRPGKSATLSYELNTTVAGNFSLSIVKAKVTDQLLYEDDRYTQRIFSNSLNIEVSDVRKSELTKINITASTLKTAKTGTTPEENFDSPATGVPMGDNDASKSIGGFQGLWFLSMILIIFYILKRQDHER